MRAGTFHRSLPRFVIGMTVLSLLSIGGCALPRLADSETAEYRRVDAQLRAADEYEQLRRTCRTRGGVIVVSESSGKFRPKVPDRSAVRCEMSFPRLIF